MISMFYQFAATTSGADRLENWLWIAVIAFVICIIVAIYQTNKKNEEEEKNRKWEELYKKLWDENHRLRYNLQILEGEREDFFKYRKACFLSLHESIELYKKEFSSNRTAIPYMARIIAEMKTVDLEMLALTVKEAENAGFRRAYKWHGSTP